MPRITALLLLAVAAAACADPPTAPRAEPELDPQFRLESKTEYTEDELYELYLAGELEATFPTYMSNLTVIVMIHTGLYVEGFMSYEYVSTTQTGGITVYYREGDKTLSFASSPPKVTGGPTVGLRRGLFWADVFIPLYEESCGKNAVADAWGEVWNEFYLVKYIIPTFSRKRGTAQGSTHAPACPTPSGGGSDPNITGLTCTTITIEHYWFYPDTGAIEYRYSEKKTLCQSNEMM
jgi:hypothetical protein